MYAFIHLNTEHVVVLLLEKIVCTLLTTHWQLIASQDWGILCYHRLQSLLIILLSVLVDLFLGNLMFMVTLY